jgi:hypothetical protein
LNKITLPQLGGDFVAVDFCAGMGIVSIFVLLEKSRLRSSLFGLPKVTPTNSNESITLLWTLVHPFSQLQGNVRQFLAGGGRRAGRVAAGKNLELACLQFENHRTCYP